MNINCFPSTIKLNWQQWGNQRAALISLAYTKAHLHTQIKTQCNPSYACVHSPCPQKSFVFLDCCSFVLQIGLGFKATHIEGLELKYMGQQTMGHYPIHFHMAGDVDEKGGYNPPTYVKDTSIHNTFSRCVTVHGSNGLLVRISVSALEIKTAAKKLFLIA